MHSILHAAPPQWLVFACEIGGSAFSCGMRSSEPTETAQTDHLAEIAEILAAGLMRLRARKSNGLLPGESDFSLETLARQSGAVAEIEGDTP